MTYEIIGYREGAHQIPEDIKMEAALYSDGVDGTFNSVDIHNRYPAIFPNPRTPVVYGIRGVNRVLMITLNTMGGIFRICIHTGSRVPLDPGRSHQRVRTISQP